MNETDIKKIIESGENERVEFKVALRDLSILVKNVSALANTNGGFILVGVEEPNRIVGTDPDQVCQLVERARHALSPTLDLDVSIVSIKGKSVAVISIPRSPEIVLANGMALKRSGAQNLSLTPEEIARKLKPESKPSEKIDLLTKAVSNLTDTVEQQSAVISGLQKQQKNANTPRAKAIDYFIGGLVGAVLGALITAFF